MTTSPFDLTFTPGPSQLSPAVRDDIREALELRIPEISHRSAAFSELSAHTQKGLREFFGVPEDYTIFYVPSATDAMEMLIRNCVAETSFHCTCGNFSEVFAEVADRNGRIALRDCAEWGTLNDWRKMGIPKSTELIAVTYCETSTGVQWEHTDITALRRAYPDPLLCVDITSTAGMQAVKISDADAWFFSVQKGFGIPSGLGILIVSPRALLCSEKLAQSGKNTAGLFSFEHMRMLMDAGYQTINTPNVLAIHLLGKQLERWVRDGGVGNLERDCREKAAMVYEFLERSERLRPFVQEEKHQSHTVVCIGADASYIGQLHQKAASERIVLGSGYGRLKDSTFRIATFPAIQKAQIERVIELLSSAY